MPKFALLLNHDPTRYDGLSQDDYMDIIKDYVSWVEAMVEQGVYHGGHKLEKVGKVVERGEGEILVRDTALSEITEILGGLMVIEAADIDAAVEIARGHPHLKHNLRLEVRPLDEHVED